MKKIFEILPASVDATNCVLLCEMSNEGFSFAIKNEAEKTFSGLGVYHFDKSTPVGGFPIALQIVFHQNKLLASDFKKVVIVYSFEESVLVPFSLREIINEADVLNLVHGDLSANDTILSDVIAEKEVYNYFRIPTSVLDVLHAQFPNAEHFHQYSFLLKGSVEENNKLSVIFYSQKMVVSLIQNGKFQLINTYNYNNPQEVSYTLLNICQQFNADGILVEISGLVEKKSPLFKEVYKYFENVQLAVLPENTQLSEDIQEHPSHYFNHIFALDSCG
jgi:hypothetical protein